MSETMTGTPLPRTQAEMAERTKAAVARDMFGFEWHEYLNALDYDGAMAAGCMRPNLTRAEWDEVVAGLPPTTVESLSARAKDYMPFWLSKIEGQRGISVCRATAHFTAWKWLLGHPDADTFPGSVKGGDGGWYQQKAYDYIRAQMESGEWDRLTDAALGRESGR